MLFCVSSFLFFGVVLSEDDAAESGAAIDYVDSSSSSLSPSSFPANATTSVWFNDTKPPVEPVRTSFEKFISVVGPGTFFLLALMTGIGNTLIIVVILLNRSMHNFQVN